MKTAELGAVQQRQPEADNVRDKLREAGHEVASALGLHRRAAITEIERATEVQATLNATINSKAHRGRFLSSTRGASPAAIGFGFLLCLYGAYTAYTMWQESLEIHSRQAPELGLVIFGIGVILIVVGAFADSDLSARIRQPRQSHERDTHGGGVETRLDADGKIVTGAPGPNYSPGGDPTQKL